MTSGKTLFFIRNHKEFIADNQHRQLLIRSLVVFAVLILATFHVTTFLLQIKPLQTTSVFLLPFSGFIKNNAKQPPVKTVLLWTDFFSNSKWSDHFERNGGPWVELEAGRRCLFTIDRSLLKQADAVVFHGRDLKFHDLPLQQNRSPNQRWVFYLIESPNHSGFHSTFEWQRVSELGFNWTMSYTKQADVYFPYGKIRSLPIDEQRSRKFNSKIANFTESFWQRPKDAVWIVSNCGSQSYREAIVSRLSALNVSIDVWGSCGKMGRPEEKWRNNSQHGERDFFSRYRFYLAFENSLCDNYITEKAFHAFYANFISGSIPIVYGQGDYSDFFLNGSYINAGAYPNVTDLALLIKDLSQPGANLADYYQWQKQINPLYEHGYEIDNVTDNYIYDNAKRPGWQNLCQKLWQSDHNSFQVLNSVQTALGKCYQPKLPPW